MSEDLVKRLREGDHFEKVMSAGQAADRIEELEAKLAKAVDRIDELAELLWEAENDAKEAEDYAGEMEAILESIKAKLAKAVGALYKIAGKKDFADDPWSIARTTLRELTGGKDE